MGIPEELAKAALPPIAPSSPWRRATAGFLSVLVVVTLCVLSAELHPHGPDSALMRLSPRVLLARRQVAGALTLEPREASPSGSHLAVPFCWPGAEGQAADRPLEVSGPECSTCQAGELCTFWVYLRPPARWETPGTGAFEWDLMVTLVGPTMVHGYISPSPTMDVNDTFVVAYRIFDPGNYRAVLVSNCRSLAGVPKLAAYPWHPKVHILALWNVTVRPAPSEDPISPCQVPGTQGRWVRQDGAPRERFEVGAHYDWEFFPCAGATPVSEATATLASRGFFDLAFYGDSHVRQMLFHSMYLMQNFTDPTAEKAHTGLSFNFTVPVPNHLHRAVLRAAHLREELLGPSQAGLVSKDKGDGALLYVTVKFNFYWVDGIYRNKEFGCKARGLFSRRLEGFPDFPNTTDVIITDSGVWTAGYCTQPLLAYAKHLTDLYDHVKSGMRQDAKLVTFGTIPSTNCDSKPQNTNSMKAYMNNLARTLGKSYGARNFDMWEVVAPRFALPCLQVGDNTHYSCYTPNRTEMQGLVGKAIALAALHFLNHIL